MAFILHFFPPSLSLSCQPVRCGDIDIGYPFYTNAEEHFASTPTACKGKFPIDCDVSPPVIQFMGVNYNVRSISYPDQVITIQDQALNSSYFNKECSFLYYFTTPIPNFDVSSHRPLLYADHPFMCTQEDYNSSISLFRAAYNYTLCRDYGIYYWNKSEYQLDRPSNCSTSQSNLYTWMLSYREENESLSFSLLSAGFSRQLELRKECFNCQLQGKNCSGIVATVEHNCLRKEEYLTGKGSPVDNLNTQRHTIIGVTVSLILGSLLLSCIIYFVWRKKKTIRKDSWNEDEDIELPFYDLDTVIAATDNFSTENKLGEGGFGMVYKGKLPEGQEIAVKRLSKTSKQGVDEFKNEVLLIAKLQHRNLVRLLGCCARGEDRMLIYEYMPNKSLDAFLFDKAESINLGWRMRFSIIIGIARGLLYLHQDSRFRIIHRDLKASNVLLDEEMNPKISDFGLARIFGAEEATARTRRVVGTYGYMSPEYAMDGVFSIKSDVFSFGVLVLEIVSGQRTKAVYLSEPEDNLLRKAWRLWSEGKGLELTDPAIGSDFMLDEITRCIKVGLLCVQENPKARPKMSLVVHMLSDREGASIFEPQQPGFTARSDLPFPSSPSTNQALPSINDITNSLDVGR